MERHAGLIRPGGKVLDLACGDGRHSLYLAGLDKRVTAVDIDIDALAKIADHDRIEIVQADLEHGPWPLAGRRFDGIVVVNYLFRPLFPRLIEALCDGGILIYDTFARGNEIFGRPRNPAFLLEPGELLKEFSPSLTIVAYEFGVANDVKPALRQRLCARKDNSVSGNE